MATQLGIFRFAEESWSELKKVSWPGPDTVIRLTAIVLVISGLVGLYIFVADNLFTAVITRPLLELGGGT